MSPEQNNASLSDIMAEDAGVSQESSLEMLTKLGYEQIEKENEIAEVKEILAQKEDELKKIRNGDLPKILNDLGMESFTLKTGEKVEVKKLYFGSIKDNEEQYFKYLQQYGMDDIIKNIVTVTLGKEANEQANKLVQELLEQGFDAENKKTIHASTLKAHIKERLEGRQKLMDAYIEQGGIPCSPESERWPDYLEFAKSRDQEADLVFPSDLCKAFIIEQSKIVLPKKKK